MGPVGWEVGRGRGVGGGFRQLKDIVEVVNTGKSSHRGPMYTTRLKRRPAGSDSNSRSLTPNWSPVLASLPHSWFYRVGKLLSRKADLSTLTSRETGDG